MANSYFLQRFALGRNKSFLRFFGLLLVVLGVLFLLQNIGVLSGASWGIIWPVLLIILGLSIVFKKNKHLM